MNRFNSQVCLLDEAFQDDSFQADSKVLEDSLSSGYESEDSSSSSPPSPAPKPRTLPSVFSETMVYSNTDSLCDSLQLILSMPEMCDVTFLVGDKQLPVHGIKAVMATRSRIFYQMFLHHQRKLDEDSMSSKTKPKSKKKSKKNLASRLEIRVPDYDAEVFSALISFLHCGRVTVKPSTAPGIICAASEFGLRDLYKACWDYARRLKGQGKLRTLLKSASTYSEKKPAEKLLSEIHSNGA